MIPSNVDSRRPDKVQRYKPSQANGNAPGDDLTPDYMNILGPEPTTANAEAAPSEIKEERRPSQEPDGVQLQPQPPISISVIPMTPQYGIANIQPPSTNDIPSETITHSTDTITETTAKSGEGGDNKDMHSTPSRNDRFKVVKIASLEPFRRGRWKCMDYVDQPSAPATTSAKVTQAAGGVPLYMHTQSLPQQHFQQMLLQGYANPQFFQNVPSQIVPQNQYFYTQQPVPNMQTQTLPPQIGVAPGNVQPVTYISTTQQYMQPNVVPNSVGGFTVQGYPNVQYVPSNLIPNQASAFIPTSQNVSSQIPASFQQSQTYAGAAPNVSQPNVAQPIVNGHTFSQQTEQVASSLPTQVGKNAILNTQAMSNPVAQNIGIQGNQPAAIQTVPVQPVVPNQYTQALQGANYQIGQIQTQVINPSGPNISQVPVPSVTNVNPIPTSNPNINPIPTNSTTASQNPTSVSQVASVQQIHPTHTTNIQMAPHIIPIVPYDISGVYANPTFVTSVNSLPIETIEKMSENAQDVSNAGDGQSDNVNSDETSKANPVVNQVNAIDNKIEQAMDLVKSHLMYTVREEVEVLKEKITELMEKIQQLETENNFLRSQIPKNQNLNPNGTPDPPQ